MKTLKIKNGWVIETLTTEKDKVLLLKKIRRGIKTSSYRV